MEHHHQQHQHHQHHHHHHQHHQQQQQHHRPATHGTPDWCLWQLLLRLALSSRLQRSALGVAALLVASLFL
ncbi:unnamed protein product, partial [Lampetra planeri]